ncbi:wnt inhibitory factor 1-like isoform X2 [Pomacea canaliculata]|uniref:wnt inhibitory factor 1-like isoform X2 n=1 Tax=Pomacea canaliculata TaxID=400727 RepID=UPI000D730D1B|nr:wnt inhibitory factor 1-like isoform X2 [Pomacea canaliculata]
MPTRESTPLRLLLLLLLALAGLGRCRSRGRSRLALWIDRGQVESLIGVAMKIPIITDGTVTPYLNEPGLSDQIVIPSTVDTVNLTWQAGHDEFTYVFDNFTSLDPHLLYPPLLGIPTRGQIPSDPTAFQITIPCKGTEKGVASLVLGLTIYTRVGRPLKGTPIKFKLRKQCVVFALCNPVCQNNGTCISPEICACPSGYHGKLCEKAACGRPCENGGHCLPEGFCWCEKGFYGDACEFSICNPLCANGGTCIGPDRCECPSNFSGTRCETKEERPRRSKTNSKEQEIKRQGTRAKRNRTRRKQKLERKLVKAERRLLKVLLRNTKTWVFTRDERRVLRKLQRDQTKEENATLLPSNDRNFLVLVLTRERNNLKKKHKKKLRRYKKLLKKLTTMLETPKKKKRVYV